MSGSVRKYHDYLLCFWDVKYCPVCYIQYYLSARRQFMCMVCESLDSLYFCLICGFVGCIDKIDKHATEHYEETKHKYVVRLEDFQVHDYEKDTWSHAPQVGDRDIHIPASMYSKCPCFVCLHSKTPRLIKTVICMECEIFQPNILWVCNTCGHVGCHRDTDHAFYHYEATGHNITTNIGTFTTYDYVKKSFVEFTGHISKPSSEINRSDGLITTEESSRSQYVYQNEIAKIQSRPWNAEFSKRLHGLEKRMRTCMYLTEENKKEINSTQNYLLDLETNEMMTVKRCDTNEKT